jgi:serine/threonine protein phosphatase PrpC
MSRATPSGHTQVAAAGKTDVGRRRKHNEDSILLRPELRLFVVADGMGGHNAGEVASALAARSVENFFAATKTTGLPAELVDESEHRSLDAQRLVEAVRKANSDVFEIASTRRQHAGMGSTLVAAYVSDTDRRVHICHVGDSRCYRIRGEAIEQLTRDHSLINDALAMRPDLTEEILAELPKNVITRAVGTQDTLEVDLRSEELRERDLYLLCSDGLSGLIEPDQILDVSGLTGDLDELCELLVIMANEAGGPDNISVLAIRIDSVPAEGVAATEAHDEALAPAAPAAQPPYPAEAVTLAIEEEAAAEGAPEDEDAPEDEEGLQDEDEVEVEVAGEVADRADEPAVEPAASGPAVVAYAVMSVGEDEPAAPPVPAEPVAPAPLVRSAEEQTLVCAVCGHELPEDIRFCVECGTRVEEQTAAVVSRDDLLSPEEAIDIQMEEEDVLGQVSEEDSPAPALARPAERATPSPGAAAGTDVALAVCHACGAKLLGGNRFCVECGARA